MRSNRFKKTVSVFLSLMMLLTALAVGVVPLRAKAEGSEPTMLARYFSTDSEWYDAVKGSNQLDWQVGSYTAYQADGSHYFDGTAYLKILTQNLFADISEDTGIAFSYKWRPDQNDAHRHIISLGANAYNGSSNANSHFYISATTSWMSDGKAPFVGYVNNDGDQLIGAYPANAPAFKNGKTYDITVSVSVDKGVVFYINGVKYDAAYYGSNFEGQQANITEFLNTVSGWNQNYIGVSRWADGYIKGYLKDLRIYGSALSDADVYTDLAAQYASQISGITQTALTTPASFGVVPTVLDGHPVSEGWYQNVVYDTGMYFTDQFNKAYTNYKYVVPSNTVLVYDGNSTPAIPVEFEAWAESSRQNCFHAVTASAAYFGLNANWNGYMDGKNDNYTYWGPTILNENAWFSYQVSGNVGVEPSECKHIVNNAEADFQQTNTSTHRFWWNKLVFTGASSFTDNVYLLTNTDVSFTFYASSKGTGSRQYENDTKTTGLNVYVINYAPVYNLLYGANSPAWTLYSEATGSNAWMYTEESVAKAKLAAYYLVKCNPNNYNFADTANSAAECANDIKLAYDFFNTVSLVKKTATVHITQGEGTTLSVTNNGFALIDGATVTYGDTLSATAAAMPGYNQNPAAITITGGTVSGNSTLVNEPDIYISTADLPLNRYSIIVNEGEGTEITYSVSEIPDANGKYPHGAVVTASASALTGYDQSTASLSVTGGSTQSVSGGVYTVSMTSDVTLSTNALAKNKYQVTVTTGTGTVISGVSTGEYEYGTELTVTAAADTGYTQSTPVLSVTGETVTGTSHTFTVTGPVTVSTNNLSLNTYTVTFSYGDDQTSTVTKTHGATLTTADIPTDTAKTSTPSTDYTFTGWDGDTAAPITGDVIFTAQYGESARKYTVTVTTGEGTEITGVSTGEYAYGAELTVTAAAQTGYTGTPTLKVDGTEVSNPYSFTVTSDVTITTDPLAAAVYYTVIFNNYDNTELYRTDVPEGGTASYPYADPAKPAEGAHTFAFAGWDKPLENITETTVFTAQFDTVHSFTVSVHNETHHGYMCAEPGCGEIDWDHAEPHVFDVTVTDREATCSVEGYAHQKCSACGYETNSASVGYNENNHKRIQDVPAVIPTCSVEGFTAGKQCADCGVFTVEPTSLGYDYSEGSHSYGAWESNGDGTHSKTCALCAAGTENHVITEDCAVGADGTAATCASPAVCGVCGESFGAADPNNHANLQSLPYTAPTCENPGNNACYYCSGCGNYYLNETDTEPADILEDIIIGALGHAWSVTWNWDTSVTPPTATASFSCANDHDHDTVKNATVEEVSSTAAHCGESGSVTYKATYIMNGVAYTTDDPENNQNVTVSTNALPHLWRVSGCVWSTDHSTVTINLVCDRDGSHTASIANVPASPVEISAADCENDRIVKYTATGSYTDALNDTYSFTVESEEITLENSALGHSYEFVEWTWAEDHASATASFRCTREGCDHTTSVTDLNIETVTVRPADCEYDRTVKYTASVELVLNKGEAATVFTDTTDEITLEGTKTNDHAWGEPAYVWNDDHTELTATRVCGNYSSHVETETVSAEYFELTPAKCTEDGSTEYRSAAFTNPAFSAQTYPVTLTQLGHDFSVEAAEDDYLKLAATCTEPAVYYKSCSRCGTKSTEETDTFTFGEQLGHDFDDTIAENVTIVDASCTEPGMKTVKCSRCTEKEETVIQPLGHDFGEWTETLAPYCTTTGEERRDCSRCDVYETRTVPALGHDWGEWIVVTPPDYGVTGLDKRVCARCGAEETRVTVLTSDADKFVKFNTVAKMKYVLTIGDGFVFDNTNTFWWYSAKELSFTVSIAPGADYSRVTVYLNGSELAPNADGSYTIPAHPGNDNVTVVPVGATPSGSGSGTSSGACPYCGQTHGNSLWGRIVALFHTILAFFRNLFRR